MAAARPTVARMPETLASIEIGPALEPVKPMLEDVWRTEDDPDYGGTRWLELYRGTPLDPLFVMSDCAGNALHVMREGRELLTITYLPGWLFELATHALTLRGETAFSLLRPEDLDTAQPLRIEVRVEQELIYEGPGLEDAGYTRLPFGYDFAPAQAVVYEEGAEPSAVSVPRDAESVAAGEVRWTPPSLRLGAAPGVGVDVRPVLEPDVLGKLRQAYLGLAPPAPATLALQALRFELERPQDPFALPALGAPARATPLAESGLTAQSTPLADGRPLIVEQGRPDGVDLFLVRVFDSYMADVSWLRWVAEQAMALPGELLRGMVNDTIRWMGGLPDDAPLAIRLRFDPASPDDRFAYRIEHLDANEEPVARHLAGETDGGPLFRLSVVRTEGVTVYNDMTLSSWGESAVAQLVDFREEVVSFHDVPFFIEAPPDPAPLRDVPATVWDLLRVAHEIGEWVPLPQVQMFYDLQDVASLGTYMLYGKDVLWRDMTRLDAGLTLAGLILPELAERGAKRFIGRLHMPGDDPAARVTAADAALLDEDHMLAEGIAPRLEVAP
jgi:hypothetical protein